MDQYFTTASFSYNHLFTNRTGNVTLTMTVEMVQMKVYRATRSIENVHLMNSTAAMPSVSASLTNVMEKMTVEIILMKLTVVSR